MPASTSARTRLGRRRGGTERRDDLRPATLRGHERQPIGVAQGVRVVLENDGKIALAADDTGAAGS